MQETLREQVLQRKVPVLGVCVGMQILAGVSEEGRLHGLGWIAGAVKKIDTSALAQGTMLPHMGWNNVTPVRENKLLRGLDERSLFYFLHSYYFQCHNENDVLATTNYGGQFASVVGFENIHGVQFHPEKSHEWGLRLLRNFAEL